MNEFEKSRDRIVKWVEPQDNWTEEDWEHYRTVIKALDKQIPKKANVSIKGTTDFNTSAHCPTCHKMLIGSVPKYCSNCGQALDWSDEE